jgi:hypothetical protein
VIEGFFFEFAEGGRREEFLFEVKIRELEF